MLGIDPMTTEAGSEEADEGRWRFALVVLRGKQPIAQAEAESVSSDCDSPPEVLSETPLTLRERVDRGRAELSHLRKDIVGLLSA